MAISSDVFPISYLKSIAYVDDLLADIGKSTRLSRDVGKREAAPPTLASMHTYAPKEDLVQQHCSRFKQGTE